MKDNLFIGDEVREKLMSGIRKVAEAVGGTMGTGGSNAIIEAIETPYHIVTNDGYSIANAVFLSDPIENIGKNILLESINRANKASGDGSSTTCVLTSAILEEGIKHIKDISPMELKRQLESCVPLIEQSIKEQTREVDIQDIGQVATISAEDESIGNMIGEIYQKIGKDGIIHWDISKTSEDSYTIGAGLTIEGAGYFSPYMCDVGEDGNSTNRIRIKDAHVLITKQKISSLGDLNNIAQALDSRSIKDLVVFCDEIEPLVVPTIIKARLELGFRIIAVKMPVLWKDWWYEDLALASGAKIIDPAMGLSLAKATLDDLGEIKNITITKSDTFIDGINDLSNHIKELEAEGSDDAKLRASRLNTKTARYFIGAQSDSALSYRRLKVEDAISASWQALHGGVVAGGGVALRSVPLNNTIGGKILQIALQSPEQKIWENAGLKDPESPFTPVGGYDTRTGIAVNMFEAHITDPANVVLNAVRNAISVASTVLTAKSLVILPRKYENTEQMPKL